MNGSIAGNTMTLRHFSDFYYLEALMAGLSMAKSANSALGFRHSFERLESDVNEAFNHLTATMAKRIFVYIWAACLGEARHANTFTPLRFIELRSASRNTVYNKSLNIEPTAERLEMLYQIFNQKEWGDSFGGAKWLDIVKGLMLYGKVSDATFIDHAVDLEHNGGNIFTKEAYNTLLDVYDRNSKTGTYNATDLRYFLNFKFGHDILNEKCYGQLEVSGKVYRLMSRYANIVGTVKALDYVKPALEWLGEIIVNWGDATLTLNGENGIPLDSDEEPRPRYDEKCENCGGGMMSQEHEHINGDCVCKRCFRRYEAHLTTCENCGEAVHEDDTSYVDGEDQTWCETCITNHQVTCESCNKEYHNDHTITSEDDIVLCDDCAEDNKCVSCGEIHYSDMEEHDMEEHSEEAELERKQEETRKKEGVTQLPLFNPVGKQTFKVTYAWDANSEPHIHTEHTEQAAYEQAEVFKLAGAKIVKVTEVK